MHWSAEEFVLVITAFLFLGLVASSLLPGVELTSTTRATFAIGAAAFVGTAALLARIGDARYPPFLWVLPAIPVIILGFLLRGAINRERRDTSPAEPHMHSRRLPTFLPPLEQESPRHEAHHGLRARASDPAASPHELARIAYSHPEIRATVAGNPATPANLLEWLAAVGDTTVHAAISARQPAPLPGRVTA